MEDENTQLRMGTSSSYVTMFGSNHSSGHDSDIASVLSTFTALHHDIVRNI